MTHPFPVRKAAAALCAFVLYGAAACDQSARETADTTAATAGTPLPPPPAPAAAASAMTDTVPLESLVMWDAAGAQAALLSDGMRPRMIRQELSYAGLPNGVALGVGTAELHLFFFGDIAAADAAYRRLDVRNVRPVGAASGAPTAMINNNMLVIVFGGDAALRNRLGQSLRPGADNFAGEQVEP